MSEKDNRQWWRKKTNWGLILIGLSKTMTYFEITAPFTPVLETVGMILTGYGIADRVTKK